MKATRLTKLLVLGIHDLTCALGELEKAAVRYVSPRRFEAPVIDDGTGAWRLNLLVENLAVAAVGFTIQLAIEAGHDPSQMRDLERDLISLLKGDASQGEEP